MCSRVSPLQVETRWECGRGEVNPGGAGRGSAPGGGGGGSEAGFGNKLIVGHFICKEPAFRVPRKKVSLVTNFVWFYRISWPS